MITASGIGSGIDVESIITQLMALEREPVTALEQKKNNLDIEISAFGSVKSAMNELAAAARTLKDDNTLGPFVGTSSDEDVLEIEVSSGTAAEQHEIEVISLAKSHRVASSAYASADDAVGTGTYSFASGENSFEIEIDATNNSLIGLRNAINDSSENTSIAASILSTDDGDRLILTAREGGNDNTITASGNVSFTTSQAPQDAQLIIDNFTVTSSSNTVTGAIAGMTLHLKDTGTSDVTTARDTQVLEENVQNFVTRYNSLVNVLNSQSNGNLQGDRLPRNAEYRMRSLFQESISLGNGDSIMPWETGLSFDENGILSLDSGQFGDSLENGLERLISAFSDTENGFANRFVDMLEDYTQAGGLIDSRQDGLESRKSTYDDQISRYEYRLERMEVRLRSQYSAMDSLVAELQATSGYLTNFLSSSDS